MVPSPNKMLNPSRKQAAKPLVMAKSPPPAKKVIPDKVASPERTIVPGDSSSNMAPPLNTSTPAKGDSFALWSVQFLCPVNWRYLFHTCLTWSVHSFHYPYPALTSSPSSIGPLSVGKTPPINVSSKEISSVKQPDKVAASGLKGILISCPYWLYSLLIIVRFL